MSDRFRDAGEAAVAFEAEIHRLLLSFCKDGNSIVGSYRALVSYARKQELLLSAMGLDKQDLEDEKAGALRTAEEDAAGFISKIPKDVKGSLKRI